MRKIRGFKLGKRLAGVSKWVARKTRKRTGYQRLDAPPPPPRTPKPKPKPISKLITWGRRVTTRARTLCLCRPADSGYIPMGQDTVTEKKETTVPKGHLAVYVGQKDGDFHRVLVPVIYFNHPLFGELLREAEQEYGFHHQGGITIPCRISEFESVQTRIAAGCGGARKLMWKRHY
ncbi:Auxin-induced protein X10A [Morella rubra]|uniref:Auxin-induced protein X10A n=1 Tax=Morella rubra TaxID=262757 RepID=A0A6A1WJH3_9ROSI|nr:Auxin-induced protein X10A [Morella rubra]